MSRPFDPAARSFPHLAWAWPQGGRHLLLTAAICPDDARAFQAIETWLRTTDLDAATFSEHRLLAAITTRFDARLGRHAAYGRLCGLQRLNWTKSRMAVQAVLPALRAMVEAGLRVVLMKGASRVALDPAEQKSRTSHDVDLLLSDADFAPAFEVLAADGWASSRGESAKGLRARISTVQARNFKKAPFGNIDLHRSAYHVANADAACDARLFDTLQPAQFYGLAVFVPSVEERLAIAIGHGGWDGHSHSDWLVDMAAILRAETIDWDRFMQIVAARRLGGPCAVALSYLHHGLGVPVPQGVMDRICGRSGRARISHIGSLVLAKESALLSPGQKTLRRMVRAWRKARHSGRSDATDAPEFRALTRPALGPPAPTALEHTIAGAPVVGHYEVTVELTFALPPVRRRIEIELNGPTRNICHFQALHGRKTGGVFVARFRGTVSLTPEDFPLTLSSLPGKLMEDHLTDAARAKYGAVPFTVAAANLRLPGATD